MRLCVRLLEVRDKHYLRKSADGKAHIGPVSGSDEHLADLCFAICRYLLVVFITSSNLTHNLSFLFPVVFL